MLIILYGPEFFNYPFIQSEIQNYNLFNVDFYIEQWLNIIKIKASDQSSYCDSPDDTPHFFYKLSQSTRILEILD